MAVALMLQVPLLFAVAAMAANAVAAIAADAATAVAAANIAVAICFFRGNYVPDGFVRKCTAEACLDNFLFYKRAMFPWIAWYEMLGTCDRVYKQRGAGYL